MLIHAFQGHQNSLSSSQLCVDLPYCGRPVLKDPGKLERHLVRSQIKLRKYTPSFEVRILRKFFALAATTLVLLTPCSL